MLSHSKALSEKWTVIFWLKASKPFVLRSRDIFAQRGPVWVFQTRLYSHKNARVLLPLSLTTTKPQERQLSWL